MMPNLGPTELIIVLVLVIIVFGVGKLPEVGGALGKSIKEFRKASVTEEEEAKAKEDEAAREAERRRQLEIDLEVERRLKAEREKAASETGPKE